MPQMVMRGAVRLVLIGSLSRGKARQKFSRIKAESEYGAAEFLTKPVDFDQLKIQLREVTQRIKSDSNVRKPPHAAVHPGRPERRICAGLQPLV
jgi:DNA-binding NtrC family response regulator